MEDGKKKAGCFIDTLYLTSRTIHQLDRSSDNICTYAHKHVRSLSLSLWVFPVKALSLVY